jgi:hypothetical protein
VLGIAARVFGVDISPLSEKMDEVTSFMGRQMVDFNNCVSGILGEAAAKTVSAAASAVVSDDTSAHAMAQIEEFRDSPDSAAVSQLHFPDVLEGDALDQLISAVQELGDAMRSNRQYINGLHCYTVTRPTAVLPDKVMWLCEHHRDLLQQWDASAITEEQLLERRWITADEVAGWKVDCRTEVERVVAIAMKESAPDPFKESWRPLSTNELCEGQWTL